MGDYDAVSRLESQGEEAKLTLPLPDEPRINIQKAMTQETKRQSERVGFLATLIALYVLLLFTALTPNKVMILFAELGMANNLPLTVQFAIAAARVMGQAWWAIGIGFIGLGLVAWRGWLDRAIRPLILLNVFTIALMGLR